MNGAKSTSPRAKRKPSPFDAIESGRPSKQYRVALNGRQSAGDNTPDIDTADLEMNDLDYIDETALQAISLGDTAEWQATIENVVRNVVSIRFCQTCSFDTDPALNSEATGFVVDAERGYILTNRHVVGSGPFWGYCIFDNHEEVDAYVRSPEKDTLPFALSQEPDCSIRNDPEAAETAPHVPSSRLVSQWTIF